MRGCSSAGKGWLRKPIAGIDVRGDGTFMPYRGGVRREELDPSKHETPFELVRETLNRPSWRLTYRIDDRKSPDPHEPSRD